MLPIQNRINFILILKTITILSIVLFLSNRTFAQGMISNHPYSFTEKLAKDITSFSLDISRKEIQEAQLYHKKMKEQGQLYAPRTAKSVHFTINDIGQWDILGSGDRIWRWRVCSKGAEGLSFLFSKMYIPQGAAIYFYNKDKTSVIGPITETMWLYGLAPNGLEISGVMGDEIYVEIYEPKAKRGQFNFILQRITHRFNTFPYSFYHSLEQELTPIMTPVYSKLKEVLQKTETNTPPYIAVSPNWTPKNSGTWSKLKNGDKIWRLHLDAKFTDANIKERAKTTEFTLSPLQLPKNAYLHVYSYDKSYVSEKIDIIINTNQSFMIPNNDIIIEMYIPRSGIDSYKLNFSNYGHQLYARSEPHLALYYIPLYICPIKPNIG